ncbi:DUF1198 domain-containing protein, partial [Enterobacter asburiae]
MVWIMLATLAVVFVVGFRVLTSDSRRAIKRLSERLGITPMPVESMIDQFGKTSGNEFIRYLERPDEAHLQNAAQVLLIWQVGNDSKLLIVFYVQIMPDDFIMQLHR